MQGLLRRALLPEGHRHTHPVRGACSRDPTLPYLLAHANSSDPLPPPRAQGGTYANRTGLQSQGECTKVEFGEWAPTGAVLPEQCFTGFRCPGYDNDKENDPPGSKPILASQGGALEEKLDLGVL